MPTEKILCKNCNEETEPIIATADPRLHDVTVDCDDPQYEELRDGIDVRGECWVNLRVCRNCYHIIDAWLDPNEREIIELPEGKRFVQLSDEIRQGGDEGAPAYLVLNPHELHLNGVVPEYAVFESKEGAQHHAESNAVQMNDGKPWNVYPLYAGCPIEIEL